MVTIPEGADDAQGLARCGLACSGRVSEGDRAESGIGSCIG